MITDNRVEGDSRVQKVASSTAAHGYDVLLIGPSQDGQTHTYEFAGSTVQLVPVPGTNLAKSYQQPGRSLRWPFAYPSKERERVKTKALRDRTSSTNTRAARVKAGRIAGNRDIFGRIQIHCLRFAGRIAAAVHVRRVRQLARAIDHRKSERSPLDRLRARTIRRFAGASAWRRLDPTLVDFDSAFAELVFLAKPDLIHAHDFRMVGIGVRAAERLRAEGHACQIVYDAHEFMPGVRPRNLSWQLGNIQHERRYAPRADAVITVSDTLAEMLQDALGLLARPAVVLNAPPMKSAVEVPQGGIRRSIGVATDVPLIAYIGSPAPQRGLMTIVEALALMPETHAALVLPPATPHAVPLLDRAAELGVSDRLHILPYVPQESVVAFISSADVGVIPIHHDLNHEISLITKYFDYAHAGLPVVVSDVRTMASTTRELGNGEVFTAGNAVAFATAVETVLANPAPYLTAYTPELLERWSWESQERVLIDLYRNLLAR